MRQTAVIDFIDYASSVPKALDSIGAGPVIAEQPAILIKPNLVTNKPFPITTPPECCGAIIDYIRSFTKAPVVIAEGTGDPDYTTMEIFEALGYTQLASRKKISLADLNNEPLMRLDNSRCPRFPEFFMPIIAMNHFMISVPVLKAHLLSTFTGTLKNMIGLAPPKHYAGNGGIWNKAEFHIDIHQAIIDLNQYRTPDLTILDASVGMAKSHLGGPVCNPPVKSLIAGFDPVATDRAAAELLSLDWRTIGHLAGDITGNN